MRKNPSSINLQQFLQGMRYSRENIKEKVKLRSTRLPHQQQPSACGHVSLVQDNMAGDPGTLRDPGETTWPVQV